MTPQDWIGLAGGLGLASVLAVVARVGLTGGSLRSEQTSDLACPKTHAGVKCRVVRDMRIGQWEQVRSCSAFSDPEKLECAQECRRLVNLGFIVPQTRPA
jgi:hypothetical protein